jgi:hypothetical protein
MRHLRAFLGYSWAALMVPVVVITFAGLKPWEHLLVDATGLKVSPWYTGGEVARTLERPSYAVKVHVPVFRGLFGDRATGFVQVRLEPAAGALPPGLDESLDVDGDGTPDVRLQLGTTSPALRIEALSPRVAGESEVIDLGQAKAVRVPLHRW